MNTQTQIAEWTYKGASKDWYSLAAALTLSGLENRWLKLSADTQRAILGANVIGKQSVGLFDGVLMVTRKVCFGTDSDTRYVNPANNNNRYDHRGM